jgi:hypothetical protein
LRWDQGLTGRGIHVWTQSRLNFLPEKQRLYFHHAKARNLAFFWAFGLLDEAGARKTHKDTDNFLVTVGV